jgi:hypothetical protein
MPPTLWLAGYGAWPAPKRAAGLVEALQARGVTRLVDVRLAPCSSDLTPGRPYGPKPWNLQARKAGIVERLSEASIAYEWIVELGNPQRQDPAMTILRAHLADSAGDWPVHRGLERLARRIREPGAVVAALCACADGRHCHRLVIGQAVCQREFRGQLALLDLRTAQPFTGSRTIGE